MARKNKKGTVLIGSSLSNAEYARLQTIINDPKIRMSQSGFFRIGAQLLMTLTPERFLELGLDRGVEAAAALLNGDTSTVSSADDGNTVAQHDPAI